MSDPAATEIVVRPSDDDLESLFRAHYGRLVRALTVVAGDREVAADAVQEAFVKAHLHWRKVQRYDDPVGWIRRVAINRMRDDHRRVLRRRRLVDRLGGQPAEDALAADAAWSGRAEPGELAPMIASLPRQQRLAVALFYVDGLSVAEIARALDVSEGAVKFHLHEGRQRLRRTLGPSLGAPS